MRSRSTRATERPAPARRRRWWRPSGVSHATAVAYLALFMAMSGSAVAATGGNFILGRSNSAGSVSTLASTSGPVLSLRAPAGSAPLQVNRTVKVGNLNADLLDGKDASAFVAKGAFDALRTENAALTRRVVELEARSADLGALVTRVAELEHKQGDQSALVARVAELESLLEGVSRETVDGAATIRFADVNVQIVDGSGTTGGTPNGRGNLIVGYNAQRPGIDRTGSHYVVVGDGHSWSRHGGIVAGQGNRADGDGATAFGLGNTSTGAYASIVGGSGNAASGTAATVSGGASNVADGDHASVSGGGHNRAAGSHATVSGGAFNTAAAHSGAPDGSGTFCVDRCDYTSISGGFKNIASGPYGSVSVGEQNRATAWYASISGGAGNQAKGDRSSILGGSATAVTGVAACHPACS
jgi:hypothetical protein